MFITDDDDKFIKISIKDDFFFNPGNKWYFRDYQMSQFDDDFSTLTNRILLHSGNLEAHYDLPQEINQTFSSSPRLYFSVDIFQSHSFI